MEHDAGVDVSLERSSVCVVDGGGEIVVEAKVTSEPEGNGCVERFIRVLKANLLWLRRFDTGAMAEFGG